MKAYKFLSIVFSVVMLLTACGTDTLGADVLQVTEKVTETSIETKATVTETVAETSIETKTTVTETVAETNKSVVDVDADGDTDKVDESITVVIEATEYRQDTKEWAKEYAALICDILAPYDMATAYAFTPVLNEETDGDYYDYYVYDESWPVYRITKDSDDPVCSAAFFYDVDNDGVPELGLGRYDALNVVGQKYWYDFYKLDGTLVGTYAPCVMVGTVNGTVYGCDYAGSPMYMIKMSDGFPSVYYVSDIVEHADGTYERTFHGYAVDALGTTSTFQNLSDDELNTMLNECVGITVEQFFDDFEKFENYVCGDIHVPDPTNYTEEDIYNCLLPLIEEYVAKTQEQ